MSHITVRIRLSCHLLTLALVLATLGSAAAAADDSLALDTTWRGGPLRGEADRFRLEVLEPGLLTLDVSAPADAETPPTVRVLGDFELLYQSPASLVVAVPAPGAVLVAVAPEDPERPLVRYKLRNAFTAYDNPSPASEPALGIDWEVAERQEEDDLRVPPGIDWEVAERQEEDDLRVIPDLPSLCRFDTADDHPDTPLCATPLESGRSAGGELDNAFGDDEDYFTFVLAGQQTVEIAAAGEDADVLGALYDDRGQRLVAGGWREPGRDLRLVRTLSAGRYFVRLESLHAARASYTLSVTPLERF